MSNHLTAPIVTFNLLTRVTAWTFVSGFSPGIIIIIDKAASTDLKPSSNGLSLSIWLEFR